MFHGLDAVQHAEVDGRHEEEDDSTADHVFDVVLPLSHVLRVEIEEHVLTLPEEVAEDLIGLFVQGLFFELAEHELHLLLLGLVQLPRGLSLSALCNQLHHVSFFSLLLARGQRIIFSHYLNLL